MEGMAVHFVRMMLQDPPFVIVMASDIISEYLFKCIVAGICGAIIAGVVAVLFCVVRPRMKRK